MSSFSWGLSTSNKSWNDDILPRYTFQGYRITPAYDSRNRPLPQSDTKTYFDIENSRIHAMSGSTKQALPEGIRELTTYKIYTTTDIKTVSYEDSSLADRIIYENKVYKLIGCRHWNVGVIPHYEAMMLYEEDYVTGGTP